ncbi:alpha/beta hydrolase [Phenylobacterium sp.]|uniref:alpha/beta fold hydrolase n=1 Tax=Phenylobacterium sp. TaxID=1871053 RepID=UPI00301E1126
MSRLLPVLAVTATVALAASCGTGPLSTASAEDRPGTVATLPDSRNLNFRCSGRGSPTVILESGFGAGAGGWAKVQPRIAKVTHVCAYDRAGYGFSSPGPEPRDGAAIARDLDAGLDAAGLQGPYVLVGHSAGALYARLFAARRPQEVKGLVLADPTVERLAPAGRDGLTGIRSRLQRCLTTAEAPQRPGTPPDAAWGDCQRGGARAAEIARDPQTWRNRLSELDAIFTSTSAQASRTRYVLAEVPTYVITASDTAATAPQVGYDRPRSLWELQHMQMASNVRFGWQRTVFSSHLVQNDRPEVVADAVIAMVEAIRAGKPPEPLAPSETDAEDPAFGEPAFGEPAPSGPPVP